MRKIVTLLLALMLAASAYAEGEQLLLRRVADYMAKMGSYDAEVDVTAGEYRATGSYAVAGDNYHIKIGVAEVYVEASPLEKGEVSVDVVDLESRNILDNPTRCFDFVGEDYTAEIIRKDDKETTLRLVARDKAMEGEILLTLQTSTGKPLKISYLLYDDRIDVEIKSLAPRKTKLRTFSKGDYKGYDMVDFR